MATEPNYSLNVSGVDHCWPCDDTGYVTLTGTIVRHGIAYSRGTAPCKWCELGKRRYGRLIELRQHPDSNFGIADVEGWDTDDEPVGREEAKKYLAEIKRLWDQPRHSEQALKNESRSHVERRIAQARAEIAKEDQQNAAKKAAREASRPEPTPIAPPPPRGADPAGTLTPDEEGLPY